MRLLFQRLEFGVTEPRSENLPAEGPDFKDESKAKVLDLEGSGQGPPPAQNLLHVLLLSTGGSAESSGLPAPGEPKALIPSRAPLPRWPFSLSPW